MTNIIFGVHVLFDEEMREDDAQIIINAIAMVKGVRSTTVHVSTAERWAAYEEARLDLQEKIWKALK